MPEIVRKMADATAESGGYPIRRRVTGPRGRAGTGIARKCPPAIAEFHRFGLTGSYRMMYIHSVR